MPSVEFKIFRRSVNTNNFGHHQYYLVDREGNAFIVHRTEGPWNEPNWKRGDVVAIPLVHSKKDHAFEDSYEWASIGVECPTALAKAPEAILPELWAVKE